MIDVLKEHLNVPCLILLKGELGAGKTTLVKELCIALGVKDTVSSPTYSLANIYDGDIMVNHLDLYRIKDVREAIDMGIEEYLYDKKSVTLIEWPEVIQSILPESAIELKISAQDDGLRIAEINMPHAS